MSVSLFNFWTTSTDRSLVSISTVRRIAGAAKPPDRENPISYARRRNLRSLFSVGCEVKTTFRFPAEHTLKLPKVIIKSVELLRLPSGPKNAQRRTD
jgi:hypothetical protein